MRAFYNHSSFEKCFEFCDLEGCWYRAEDKGGEVFTCYKIRSSMIGEEFICIGSVKVKGNVTSRKIYEAMNERLY